jgi:molybdopterin synthase catalytic subunit/molybdopterin synthase sulfur carrier subunit
MNDVATGVRQVRIQLFGGFRQHSERPELAVEVPPSATVAALKREVAKAFADNPAAQDLLNASAIATDRRVLADDERVPDDEPLALLPPVCGG